MRDTWMLHDFLAMNKSTLGSRTKRMDHWDLRPVFATKTMQTKTSKPVRVYLWMQISQFFWIIEVNLKLNCNYHRPPTLNCVFYTENSKEAPAVVFLYISISMIHYKSLISILLTCKYTISSHSMPFFSTEKYFWKFKEHVTLSFSIENNSKNLRKSPHIMSHFSIEK
jgi:hypothetical protein